MNDFVAAFVLHTRDYRDTSLLLDFLTPDAGRVSAVAKGGRRIRHGTSQRAILQPLQPLWISWGGRGELKTLSHAEVREPRFALAGHALFSALYLNELLCRLLQREDAQFELFRNYEDALHGLAGTAPLDITLRQFELRLLEALGYGFSLALTGEHGEPIEAQRNYAFDPQRGLTLAEPGTRSFPGRDLLDFADGNFTESARRTLKTLCRMALEPHLGDRPLQSRALFVADR